MRNIRAQYTYKILTLQKWQQKNLNSEVLASLLASRNAREDFADLREEIEDFFAELEEEDEEEED